MMTDDKDLAAPRGAPGETSANYNSATKLMNAARAAKGAALLCFLLPWVTFSCRGDPLFEASGLGLAVGEVKTLPAAQEMLTASGGAGRMQGLSDSMRPDVLIIVAAVLIVTGLILTLLLRRRPATLAGMVTSVSALVLIAFDVLVRIKSGAETQLRKGGDFLAQAFSVDTAFGFWLTVLLLAVAAVLFKFVHGGRAPQGLSTNP